MTDPHGPVPASARSAVTADPTAATRPRNRRQLIVEAAGRVFSERGYHTASMGEIAAGVGITAAAFRTWSWQTAATTMTSTAARSGTWA
ncbi:hypothetical protein GCM10010129_80030 [Streptomyces fumigatiscleroticus]|nr:hypothetical protein GCM10010129_80030 [Streptomyces fumigatiscleroticus]